MDNLKGISSEALLLELISRHTASIELAKERFDFQIPVGPSQIACISASQDLLSELESSAKERPINTCEKSGRVRVDGPCGPATPQSIKVSVGGVVVQGVTDIELVLDHNDVNKLLIEVHEFELAFLDG